MTSEQREYKYLKVYQKEGKTTGVKTYSNNEADNSQGDMFPREIEIVQQGEWVGQEALLNPAKIADGFYPLDYFIEMRPMADYVPEGEAIKTRISKITYLYVGPKEDTKD